MAAASLQLEASSRRLPTIFYRSGDEMMAVDIDTRGQLTLGNPRVLFEARDLRGPRDISSDGERLLFIDVSDAPPAPTHLVLVQNWAEELKRLVPKD